MKEEYLDMIIKEALLAAQEGEIPVGALIVRNDEILALTHNRKEQMKCSTKHAEIIAIEEASKKINSWRLNDCEIYITMEPCIMCCGAILQSRIKKINYLVENDKFGGLGNIKDNLGNIKYNHQVEIEKIKDLKREKKIRSMLKDFFLNKR